MSMLSSKCDELRERAHELRMFADGLSAPYIVPSTKETMGLSMQSAATELERAADTIWSLRCRLIYQRNADLQELKAENAKLREQVVQLKNDWESERDYADQMEANEKRAVSENSKLRVENAKLRELVRKYGEYTGQDRCEGCVCKSRCNDGDVDECWQLTEIRGLAREVGIKVY